MAKRYDCTNGGVQFCQGCYQMTEAQDGDYVRSEDYDKAERALISAGYTLVDGAEAWKPPLGESVSPLLDSIKNLRNERDALLAAIDALYEVIVIRGNRK